jgi:hypothetical protein
MRINQISSKDTLTQQVVNAMINRSSVLEFAEFYSIVGNADYTRMSSVATGGRFRVINSDYPENTVNPGFANPTLKILGDKIMVDQANERRGVDIPSVRARDLLNFAGNLGRQFNNYFFNGTGTSGAITGLKLLIPSDQKITAATNGLNVSLGNSDTAKQSQQKFLELLNQLISSIDGGAQVLYMNANALSRLTTIAREQIQYQINEFGKPVAYYNGIPIKDSGYDSTGALIIPQNETVGTSNDCTSVYAVRFGEAQDLSIATNIGVEVKDLGLVGVHYVHSVDFDLDTVLLNNKAVARLEGIRLP